MGDIVEGQNLPTYRRDAETGTVTVSPRDDLLARREPSAGRVAALDEIRQRLAVDTEIFEHHGDDGRAGAWRALVDVIHYFASLGISRASLAPLAALADAVADADRGVPHPLLGAPSEADGAGDVLTLDFRHDELLAAVMECCHRHYRRLGLHPSLGPAAVRAAELVNASPLSVTVTPTQMRELRERVMQVPLGEAGRRQFDALVACEVADLRPLEWAATLAGHDWSPVRTEPVQVPLDPGAAGK